MAPRWGDPDLTKSQNIFFIALAPSRVMTNPSRRVGSFLENMNLEPQLGPVTFQNSKIVIFGSYSLWGFSKCVICSVIFDIYIYIYKTRLLNSKIVIFGDYSLLGFSKSVNFSVIFDIYIYIYIYDTCAWTPNKVFMRLGKSRQV